MAKGKSPENPREQKGDRACDDEMENEKSGLTERLNQEPRRDIGHDDHRNDPAENQLEDLWEDHVRITGDVAEIEVAVNEALRAHDPETDRGQSEHDRVMNRDAEA